MTLEEARAAVAAFRAKHPGIIAMWEHLNKELHYASFDHYNNDARSAPASRMPECQHRMPLDSICEQCAPAGSGEATGLTQVDMGFGKFAVGGCQHPETKVPGIIYLHLRDDVRPLGADTTDVYPEGSEARPDDIAALIYFHNEFALRQTIDVLLEIQRERYPQQPASDSEAVAHPLDDDSAAIQLAIAIGAYDCIHSPNGKPELRTQSGDNSEQARQMTRLAIVKAAIADGKYTRPAPDARLVEALKDAIDLIPVRKEYYTTWLRCMNALAAAGKE